MAKNSRARRRVMISVAIMSEVRGGVAMSVVWSVASGLYVCVNVASSRVAIWVWPAVGQHYRFGQQYGCGQQYRFDQQ